MPITTSRLRSLIKSFLIPQKPGIYEIKAGILKGLKMHLDPTCQSQVYLGLSEREIHAPLRQLAQGIKTAIDIGAGDGQYTLFFMANTPAEKVLAFEPLDYNRRRIVENIELNQIPHAGRLEVIGKWVNSYVDKNEVTLDSLIPKLQFPVLIKLDVDTLEGEVLEGAQELLKHPGVNWIIETHSKALERECIDVLRAAGAQTRIIKNAWWRIAVPELRPIEQNRWLVVIGHNRPYVPRPSGLIRTKNSTADRETTADA